MREKGQLRWAVLGTGAIANEMAEAFARHGRTIDAVGNRTCAKAEAFSGKYHIPKVYGDFRDMFDDGDVDVIYIATPHNTHYRWMREALRGGKHVLAEKAITLSAAELTAARRLAGERGLVLAEAQTIYHMPLLKQLAGRVSAGEFGPVRMIQINFGSYKEYDMANRFFNLELAGGALLDIGVYAISLARSFMSSCPGDIVSRVRLAESGADEMCGAVMVNREGQMAVLSISLHSKQPKRAVLSCDRAYIEIPDYPRAERAEIVWTAAGLRETVELGSTADALWYEVMDMEEAVAAGAGGETLMNISHTADVMEIMTKLRRDWGLCYGTETAPGAPKEL